MDIQPNDLTIDVVRPASIRRALAIVDACQREPALFEPVPSRPIFQDEDATYCLTDTSENKSHLAIIRALETNGREYTRAVMMRYFAMLQLFDQSDSELRTLRLVRGHGSATELSEAAIFAAAEAPCSGVEGFDTQTFIECALDAARAERRL